MHPIDRRNLIKGLAAAGAGAFCGRPLRAAFGAAGPHPAVFSKRLLLVFLRGANDGVNTVIPHGDATYTVARPVIKISPAASLALSGTSFARAHPALAPLVGASSPDGLGRIAWLHQVGNPLGDRSHFQQMDIWETADDADKTVNETQNQWGVLSRLAQLQAWPGALPGAGLAPFFRMFHTPQSAGSSTLLGAIRDVDAYSIQGAPFTLQGLAVPQPIDAQLHALLTQQLGQPPHPQDEALAVQKYGLFALNSSAALASLASFAPGFFDTTGLDPGGLFFLDQVEDAMRLLRYVPECRVVGVNFGGFDTHTDQLVRQDLLLKALASALRGVHDICLNEGAAFDGSLLTLVISEFGRTARDNGSGTDHGLGNLIVAQGAGVIGGVRNCDAATWPALDAQGALPTSQIDYNAVPVRTDFRAIYAEVFQKWFGVTVNQLPFLLPDLAEPNPPVLNQLNFLV